MEKEFRMEQHSLFLVKVNWFILKKLIEVQKITIALIVAVR